MIRFSELVNQTPKQREFFDALKSGLFKFILYGGAAGGGKSFALRWGAVLFLMWAFFRYGVQNVVVGLFCEDYPQLQKRQLSKIAIEFPKWLGETKSSKELGLHFRLAEKFGAGIIFLCNLDEPSKYDSVEFAAIFIDELTKNTEDRFDELRKRLRWPRKPKEPSFPVGFLHPFVGGTNPGGKGHAWVKRYWIDRDLPPWLRKYGDQFLFIQSKATDNPYNPESYFEELKSLPPQMAKAYAEGDWDLFVGQFFSEWRRELHVCKPFAIPSYWKRFRAIDWGFYPGFTCVLWFAVSPSRRVYIYRELYVREWTPEKVAKHVIKISADEQIAYTVIDPACKMGLQDGGKSVIEQLYDGGLECVAGSNARLAGWARVHEYLAWERDENEILVRPPMLQVFETCYNVIRTIPTLVHAETGDPEDCDTDGEDHPPDTVRYGLMTRPPLAKVPLEAMTQEVAEAALRAAQAEKRRAKHV
jgi:hypothetical protein